MASLSRTSSRTSADPMNPAPPANRKTGLLMSIRIVAKRKEVGQVREPGKRPVPFRHDRLVRPDRPDDANIRVVPGQPTLGGGIIIGGHLVHDLGVRFERTIAVRES